MTPLSFLYTFLAASVTDGKIFSIYGTIRRSMLEHSGKIVPLAMTIACVIVVFKLIRMTYTIMSDDKQGGFGGITLWEILRPVVILIMTASSTFFVGILDTVTDAVSVSISRTVNWTAVRVSREEIIQNLEEAESIMYEKEQQALDTLRKQMAANDKTLKDAGIREYYNPNTKEYGLTKGDGSLSDDEIAGIHTEMKALRTNMTRVGDAMKGYSKSVKKNRKLWERYFKKVEEGGEPPIGGTPRTTFTAACFWLCDKLAFVMMAYAEIILCCMALLSPIVIALSLIETWKNAVITFCGKYFEVSMWKVTANLILAATNRAFLAASKAVQDINFDAMTSFAQNDFSKEIASAGSAGMLATVVSIAGIFAVLSVPSITATLLSLGGGPAAGGESARGVATGMAAAPGKAIGGAVTGGKTIVGKK